MIRQNAYWAGIAEIDVTLSTGEVKVTNFTVGVELGKIINPRHLRAIIQGGIVMGLGEALTEEVTFDNGRVTSTDWSRYRIPTMADMPTIKTVEVSRPGVGFGTGGEAPNALPSPAVAAAFYDATGIVPRRVPLNPAYVTQLLKT
jgi:CO/xanthine dehydrogenase Mo-binding subunit